jgi:hypothetical protein
MKSLSVNLETFGFVEREERNGKPVFFRCGRDFLYYALTYYKPERFSPTGFYPEKIEHEGVFGLRMPWWMMWSGLQFTKVPRVLKQNGLYLTINGKKIENHLDFLLAFVLPKKFSADYALSEVETHVNQGKVSAIDISISMFGLVDHVLFIYGYDDENLFVFDTLKLPALEYEKQTNENDGRFIMKLSKEIIRKRWSRWGRVWAVSPNRS